MTATTTVTTAPDTRAAAGAPPAPARTGKRPYLHQVDLIRATTFALVIFVHTLTNTTDEFANVGVNATALLMHCTRNIFFALTGFVLMYQYLGRDDFRAVDFWRRRMKLVIFPYVLWSVVYWVVMGMWGNGRLHDVPTHLNELWDNLKWGTAGYHLYFLVVMLQVYLLFPAIRWIVDKTRGHHAILLAVSLVLQIGAFAAISFWTPPESFQEYWFHAYATFLPYQFFIFYGAVAAAHREQLDDWIRGKGRWLAAALLASAAFAVGMYLFRALHEGRVHDMNSAFDLTLLPFLVVIMPAMYAMALWWNDRLRPRSERWAKVVSYASNRSFPVFLVHVLVLFLLIRPRTDGTPTIVHALGQPWGTLVVYLLTLAVSLAVVEVLRRLPLSIYLTGRPRLPFRWQI